MFNAISEKAKFVIDKCKKRKRAETQNMDDSESHSSPIDGLISVSIQLAKSFSELKQKTCFHSVSGEDGWRLLSYVYDGSAASMTSHMVLGFVINDKGGAKVVSTMTSLNIKVDTVPEPCTNELWVLKAPDGSKYIIDGEHQGKVDEKEILTELKTKFKNMGTSFRDDS
jgi:hypothetical protein